MDYTENRDRWFRTALDENAIRGSASNMDNFVCCYIYS